LTAAFLYAQIEDAKNITQKRQKIWNKYHDAFKSLEDLKYIARPFIPDFCEHNGHMYYLLMRDLKERTAYIEFMNKIGVNTVFHYVPLHTSQAGKIYGRVEGELPVTDSISERLVRLPLWIGVEQHQPDIIRYTKQFFGQ
jgi:dTDP-4-amino-4,6-dideoxygalactose transaminase